MPDTPTSPTPPATAPLTASSATVSTPTAKAVPAPPETKAPPGPRYRLKTGLNYPDGKGGETRSEPGDVVDDLPPESVAWLLSDGHIEEE